MLGGCSCQTEQNRRQWDDCLWGSGPDEQDVSRESKEKSLERHVVIYKIVQRGSSFWGGGGGGGETGFRTQTKTVVEFKR